MTEAFRRRAARLLFAALGSGTYRSKGIRWLTDHRLYFVSVGEFK